VLGRIFLNISSASSTEIYEKSNVTQDYLSIGEYKVLSFSKDSKFAISNKGVITASPRNHGRELVIRAKHLGTSSVFIWRGNKKIEYNLRVVKRVTLASLRVDTNRLKESNIRYKIRNDEILITSKISKLNQVEIINQLVKKRRNSLIKLNLQVNLDTGLKKSLVSKIYSKLINNGVTPINCLFELLPFTCLIEKGSSDIVNISKHWFKRIPLKLISQDRINLSHNLLMKTRIILLESGSRSEVDLGLSSASAKVKKLLEKDFAALINNNNVTLNDGSAKISSIATPDIITRANKKSQISIGSEIPFSNKRDNEIYTDWKFAGLKINGKFLKSSDIYSLEIKTELSKPSDGAITTNKLMTNLNVKPGKVYKVAELYHKGIYEDSSSLSYLSKVPILGNLFTSKNEYESNKYISIFIEFEELK
jgi:pilus assembly protein CpaC